jgi:hypothetical protein
LILSGERFSGSCAAKERPVPRSLNLKRSRSGPPGVRQHDHA